MFRIFLLGLALMLPIAVATAQDKEMAAVQYLLGSEPVQAEKFAPGLLAAVPLARGCRSRRQLCAAPEADRPDRTLAHPAQAS